MPVEVMSLKGSVDIDLAPFQRKARQLKAEWEQLGKSMALKDPTTGGSAGQARRTETRFTNELQAASVKLTAALAGESNVAQQVAARYSTLSAARRQELVTVLEQQAALKSAAQAQAALGGNLKQLGGNLTLAVTAPLVAFGVHAVKVFGSAEQALNVFQQVTGATADQMKQAGDAAKALGADMSLPATSSADAAAAMVELGKAGLSASDAMAAARPALQLAAAAGVGAGEAARVAASAMIAFHLSAQQLPHVMDQLAGAANASTGEISDFALGFQQASAVFYQAGRSTSELTTSLALMANSGIRASDAGTSLRVMLIGLNNHSKQAKAAFKALQVEAFDPVTKRMKPMREQVEQFSAGLSRLNQRSQMTALKDIFGQDAMRAAQVVLGGGVKRFDQMTAAVDKQGSAAATAAAKNKGLLGAIDAMKSAFDTAASASIETISKDLSRMAKGAGELMGRFAALPEPTRRFVTVLGGVAAAAGPGIYLLGQFISSAKVVRDTMPTVARNVKLLGSALMEAPGWTKVAVLAIGALALAWSTDFLGIRTTTEKFISWATPALSATWDQIRSDALAFLQAFTDDWKSAIGGLIDSVTGAFSGFGASILDAIGAPFRAMGEAWDKVPEPVKRLILGVFPGANQIRDVGNFMGKAMESFATYNDLAGMHEAFATPGAPAKPRPSGAPSLPPTGPGDYGGAAGKEKKSPLQTELEQLQAALNATQHEATALLDGINPKIAQLMGQYRQAAATDKGMSLIEGLGKAQGLAEFKKQLLDLNIQIKESGQDDPSGLLKLHKAFDGLIPDDLINQMAEANTALKTLSKTAQGWEAMRSLRHEVSMFQGGTGGRPFLHDTATRSAMQLFGKPAAALTDKELDAGAESVRSNRVLNRNKEIAAAREEEQQNIVSATARAGEALLKTRDDFKAFASGSEVARRALEMFKVPLDFMPADVRKSVTRTLKEIMRLEQTQRFLQGWTEGISGLVNNMFAGLFDHGFKNFASDLISGFKQLWQKIAADYLASQLTNLLLKNVVPLLSQVFGGGDDFLATRHAKGGAFGAGEQMLVGEQGPELVRFNRGGSVVPNNQLAGAGAGGGDIHVHVNVTAKDAQSFASRPNQNAIMSNAFKAAARAQRRGG